MLRKNLIALGVLMTVVIGIFIVQTLYDRSVTVFGKLWLTAVAFSLAALVTALTLHFAHARGVI